MVNLDLKTSSFMNNQGYDYMRFVKDEKNVIWNKLKNDVFELEMKLAINPFMSLIYDIYLL